MLEAAKIPYPSFADGKLRLLVTGGSQGARVMSDVVPAAVELLSEEQRARLVIVQQARGEDLARVQEAYARLEVAAEVDALLRRPARAHRAGRISSSAAPAPRPSRNWR